MSQPFPCCCKCWNCTTKPDSIEFIANVVSGDNCCNHPNGTYVVGGASNSVFDSVNTYNGPISVSGGIANQNAPVPCSWSWIYKQVKSSTCITGTKTFSNFDDTSGVVDYISLCKQSSIEIPGFPLLTTEYLAVMTDLRILVKWLIGGSAPYTGRRVWVGVYRIYQSFQCAATGMNTGFNVAVLDRYISADVACDALPSSISFTNRTKTVGGNPSAGISASGDTITSFGTDYTLCPPIASVGINYA